MIKRYAPCLLLPLLAILLSTTAIAQNAAYPWTAPELVMPAELAATLADAKTPQPVILNLGTAADIKGAVNIGPVQEGAYMDKMKKHLAGLAKNTPLVIYCGCCKLNHCPNMPKAFTTVKELGFTNCKVLYLPNDLDQDWINKGYPMKG